MLEKKFVMTICCNIDAMLFPVHTWEESCEKGEPRDVVQKGGFWSINQFSDDSKYQINQVNQQMKLCYYKQKVYNIHKNHEKNLIYQVPRDICAPSNCVFKNTEKVPSLMNYIWLIGINQ